MSKLYFYHGVMGSGKSMNLLMAVYNYKEHGVKVAVIKPSLDSRSKLIKSRVGCSIECLGVEANSSIIEAIKDIEFDVLVADEVQFFSDKQIEELARISFEKDVLCYGLLIDFQGKLFDGSQRLIECGAKLQELKSIGKERLTHHLRLVNGVPVFNGNVIQCGDKEYKVVSYREFVKQKDNNIK